MPRKQKSIPVRSFSEEFGDGIAVAKINSASFQPDEDAADPHRHDVHFFLLHEKGTSYSEIDFEKYLIEEPTILYQSPNQVHRAIRIENVEMYILIISNENLKADYNKLLQEISPVKPLKLNTDDQALLQQAFSLCKSIYERPKHKLYFSLLKDSCNALVALFIAQYLQHVKPAALLSRFEDIHKAFTELLENHFATIKRPADYAEKLNISVSYLNECIKNCTGFHVSHHIQQRVILEAKRLLFHSNQSVKEIAEALGYQDHAYFSRLFTKVTGQNAREFKVRNRD